MKNNAMGLLIEHSRRRRDEAAKSQATAEAELTRARQTLEMLARYRGDKAASLRVDLANAATHVQSLQMHERFSARLAEAVEAQQGKVEGARARLEQARAETLASQQHLKAIETVVARRAAERQRKLAVAERKAADEMAAQRALRQRV